MGDNKISGGGPSKPAANGGNAKMNDFCALDSNANDCDSGGKPMADLFPVSILVVLLQCGLTAAIPES